MFQGELKERKHAFVNAPKKSQASEGRMGESGSVSSRKPKPAYRTGKSAPPLSPLSLYSDQEDTAFPQDSWAVKIETYLVSMGEVIE